jgi:hypothetical protein
MCNSSTGSTVLTILRQDIQNAMKELRADITNKEQVLKTNGGVLGEIELV